MDIGLAVSLKVSASTLRSLGDDLYWLEQRPELGGRSVVVAWEGGRDVQVVSPDTYSLTSRLHEYGGGAMEVIDLDGPLIIGVTKDQSLISFRPHEEAAVLVSDVGNLGDLRAIPGTHLVLAVREIVSETLVRRSVIAVDVVTGAMTTLLSGRDFYADIVADAEGRFACCAWDHPDMPWDAAELIMGKLSLSTQIRLDEVASILGGRERSAIHPCLLPGRVIVAAEDGEWSRVVSIDDASAAVTWAESDGHEHAVPLWVTGRRQFARLGDSFVGIARLAGFSHLVSEGGTRLTVPDDLPEELCATVSGFAWMGGTTETLGVVVRHDQFGLEQERHVVGPSVDGDFATTKATQVSVTSRHGGQVHGLLYVPPGVVLPPVIVHCHGGPTAEAVATFNPVVQAFVSRGFAVVMANYGGSTGHGARYRRRLDGLWGVIDVDDCVDLVTGLGEQGRIDPTRAAIRGGSAGGYTALLGMCSGVFACGVSLYGVAELTSLAAVTHDFESRYLDRLVGPLPEAAALYRQRSAVTRADEMRGAVLLLQGLDDPVVPPSQAHAMRDALVRNEQPVELIEYEGESHGFRRADTLIDALTREIALFERVLKAGVAS